MAQTLPRVQSPALLFSGLHVSMCCAVARVLCSGMCAVQWHMCCAVAHASVPTLDPYLGTGQACCSAQADQYLCEEQ